MSSLKLFIIFVAFLACGCSVTFGEETCDKRSENIYTKPSTDVKEFDLVTGLTNIYKICYNFYKAIIETVVKYLTQLVHAIERVITSVAKILKIEVPKMKTTVTELLEEHKFIDIFIYFYETLGEAILKPYVTNNMGDIMKLMSVLKAF
ncbi:hypothetical protein ACFFRR_007112 [Megaselia abdita]